jgi:cytoskeletal protein RodZ
MEASSQRTSRSSLALVSIIGMASVAACVAAFVWWKASAASAQVVASPEAVFVTRCDYSHTNSDDPIVHAGKPGAAHSHDFFGNRSTDHASTYESLRTYTGTTSATRSGTTCVNAADKSPTGSPPRAGRTRTALVPSNPAAPTSTIGRAARGMYYLPRQN